MSNTISASKLKRKIKNINNDTELSMLDKRQKIQEAMMFNWNHSNNKILNNLSPLDISYYNKHLNILGCEHYQKKCKILFKCCNRWYVCRHCHDEHEDHVTDRYSNITLSCMKCNKIQPISDKCTHCNIIFSKYYCTKCKYHNDDNINIFHCDKCKICNIGKQTDFIHCNNCKICIFNSSIKEHICKNDQFNVDCPVCKLKIKGSINAPFILKKCKHILHTNCFESYIQTNYKCPICIKSIIDFHISSSWFMHFNEILQYERNLIPNEQKKTMVYILCNDCERKSETTWHFELHQCKYDECLSYNTSIISLHTNYFENESENESENVIL